MNLRRWSFGTGFRNSALIAAPALLTLACGTATQVASVYRLPVNTRSLGDGPASGDVEVFRESRWLERKALVEAVLERNPSVAAAHEAWQATLARYPQVTALDDPTLSYTVAPRSIVGDARFGYAVELGQRVPFPGKRALEGAIVLAEAAAAQDDLQTTRLELALSASTLFDDYVLVERSLAINARHQELLAELVVSAQAQYLIGRASQHDVLQAEVERAHLEHDAVVLQSDRATIIAQINALLHREAQAALPPPPPELPVPTVPQPEQLPALVEEALHNRPEIGAWRERSAGGEAAARLAARQSYPDLELMARYDSMWDMPEHRWMVGLGVTVPLQQGRRRAAVAEAEAQAARARHELARARIAAQTEVFEAFRRAKDARHVQALHAERIVPAARQQVAVARAGFLAGRDSFLAVLAAERSLRTAELQLEIAHADLWRRLARLARAVGRLASEDFGGER